MKYRRVFPWLLVLLWMGLIFSQSHKPATESNKLSKGVTEIIVETVEKINPDSDVDISVSRLNHILRKNAHFFSYLLLGILTLNALRISGAKGYKLYGFALLICILYSISDEFHQTFIPGRGGQVKDVIIDSAGALVGIGLRFMKGKVKVNVKR